MTRISRVRRLASLRPTATPNFCGRSPFITTRSLSSTPCLRADEPPAAQVESAHIETESERRTRLKLPPKQTIADTEAEIAAADPTYTPATSMADLEPLPQMKTWWNQPGNWGPESQFSGFGVDSRQKITDPSLVKVMLKRAVLEVQALQQSGQYDALKFKRWAIGGKEELDRVMKGELTPEESATVAAGLQAETADQNSTPIVPPLEEAEAAVQSWGIDWMSLTLNDETKFVIRKRLYQLTGTLIPDAKLAAANTVRDLVTLASVLPKPKKLYHTLQAEAQSLPPNLKIHGRRITPIDREKAVGRWKVIEEELKKRDLPVTGHGDVASHREKVWLLGKR
ncbi:hypothetical protein NLU13_4349 [Sarocladium strictum]|uniref:Large ribosomal subunit protein mL50 n=1 Tax=Sarocladium strictum TaxID=5046 RepID=A0AA39GIP7_SARSR|nr:hypothetical protein NLU13_4349 [Sarocladium strictum]